MIRSKMDSSEPEMILEKIRYYCGYEERCISDVEKKLEGWSVQKKRIPGLINALQKEGYLDEERFAKAFAGGKFRLNKWGRQKIEFELKQRGVPELMIMEGLANIDENEYNQVLKELILRKQKELKPETDLKIREKIINFALGKGYELILILDMMKNLKI